MANANRPSGLSPVMYRNGSPWTGGGQVYCIPSTDTNAYAIGDPVTLAGSADAAGIPTVVLATAGTANVVLGAMLSGAGAPGFGQDYGIPAESAIVIPATKLRAYYILVADDPNIIFEIQEDSVGANLAATDVGSNANLVSGVNNGYISGWMLDSTPLAVTATLQLHIFRAAPRRDNAIGQYCKWWVGINNHAFAAGVAGV